MKTKSIHIIIISACFVLILDQISKYIIRAYMTLNQSISVINNIFHITYITNTGSAFGLFQNFNLPLIFITLGIIGFIIYSIPDIIKEKKIIHYCSGFILGAAFGNLIDRIVFGHVIDFLDFRIWPVFNIADSFISISIVILIIYFWKK